MRAKSFGAALFVFSGVLGGNALAQTGETLDVLATARGPRPKHRQASTV